MIKISRYEVLRTLAEGETGQVLLAFDPVIERHVVIKTVDRTSLPPDEADRTIGRFKREAIAAGRLTHPNIITVHEYGECGSLCFIAMEHTEGPTLRQYLDQNPTPALDTVRAIARQLFSAMMYAHEQGVLHRDLKPGNIVLVDPADAASMRAKVLDFGIARVDSSHGQTLRDTMVSPPGYMSPEQYQGKPVDHRTDIYSLAALLFEMLAGRSAFRGALAEIVHEAVEYGAPRVSSVREGLPAGVDAMMGRALQRDPVNRYFSMRAFREAFAEAMTSAGEPRESASGKPASPVPPSPAQLSAVVQKLKLAKPGAGDAGTRPLILLLDDEERILSALSALFRHSCEVVVATDGERALRIVQDRRPHVIVSDQRMPHMLGVDFLRQARDLDPASVRILLTGYSDLAAIVGSINDGEIFRFVNKPWDNHEFKATVAQAVEIALATRQACEMPLPMPEVSEIRRAPEAILVAQKSRELFAIVNEGFGRTRPVCYAPDIAAVLRTIEDQEVAILLCELDGFDGADEMLKMLKQSRPHIQTVAVAATATSDSDSLVSLINQAQIFRFMNRPLRLGLLDRSLRSALSVHANYKARPVLQQRQAVLAKPAVANSSIGRQILQRLGLVAIPRVTIQAP